MIQPISPAHRRRALSGLLVSAALIVLAILWGVWALLRNQTGVLIVTSRPSGAEVVLNKRPTDLLTTAFLSDLPADSFIVSLRLDGHRPVPPVQGVRIQPNDTTRVTFIMAQIARGDDRKLPPVTGSAPNWKWKTVRIDSDPPGSALVVDDRELGVITPATVLLGQGLHHLEARWPDGTKAFKNVTISPAESQPELMLRPQTYERPGAVRQDTLK
ncbi:PEGA domain-containing protein [candidate division KSB1 bacterium]|nr:PEGA domain-containing protein [candidate division KSB1 bacterium]